MNPSASPAPLNALGSYRLVVLVPAYNPGPILERTVRGLIKYHPDIWVLVDGSNDGSEAFLDQFRDHCPGVRVFQRRQNRGKGMTVLEGAMRAHAEQFTHALCVDADGQHPPDRLPAFFEVSRLHHKALVMGEPRFGSDAPLERVFFRKVANGLAHLETGGRLRWDSLFGMRVYPIAALLSAFSKTRWARGYDFDTEIAVRMVWDGVDVVKIDTNVRYPTRLEGGVSHFSYLRDNLTLARMHARLLAEASLRFVRRMFA